MYKTAAWIVALVFLAVCAETIMTWPAPSPYKNYKIPCLYHNPPIKHSYSVKVHGVLIRVTGNSLSVGDKTFKIKPHHSILRYQSKTMIVISSNLGRELYVDPDIRLHPSHSLEISITNLPLNTKKHVIQRGPYRFILSQIESNTELREALASLEAK
jgi:hypothetical protein